MPNSVALPGALARALDATEAAAALPDFPRGVLGTGGGGDSWFLLYDGEPLADAESIAASAYPALQAAANAPTPPPTRVVDGHLVPDPGLALDLGFGAERWGTLYCETVNTTSDAALKEDVETLLLGRALVDKLRPVSFRYRGKRRTHLGFIAQEVRGALRDVEPDGDFALWCETPVEDAARSGLPAGQRTLQSLRPDQLIAVLVRCCQEQDDVITDLVATTQKLKEDVGYCYETIEAIQKAIRERPPPS